MRDRACFDETGTLAGSALDMASAGRNAVTMLGLDLADASRMASRNPAEFPGLDHEFGRIARGCFASDEPALAAGGRPSVSRLAAWLALAIVCVAGAASTDVIAVTPRPPSAAALPGRELRLASGASIEIPPRDGRRSHGRGAGPGRLDEAALAPAPRKSRAKIYRST